MTVMTDGPTTTTVQVGDGEITFETGILAKQASGAVLVKSGGTAVLATATGAPQAREGTDFFPLTVDVEEKAYAAGKIPGGFFRREGRSGEKAILTARMIDRPIRPLWPKNFRNDVHCIATIVSADMENAHDILAINGISAALMISPLPFFGPVGAVRVGLIDDQIKVNPAMGEMLESDLDLIVCGSPEAITMVEAGAKVVSEDTLVEALEMAHAVIKDICAAQIELAEKVGKPKWTSQAILDEMRGKYFERIAQSVQSDGLAAAGSFTETTLVDDASPKITLDSSESDIEARIRAKLTLGILLTEARTKAVQSVIQEQFGDRILEFSNAEGDSKELKSAKKGFLLEGILAELKLPFPTGDGDGFDSLTVSTIKTAFDAAYKATVRKKIAVDKRRPDGRAERDLRALWVDVDVAAKTHGSGLFQRGQTQVLSLCTLGTTKEEQRIDDLSLETNKYYLHHYNFPPFSVGETGFMRGPKRRDIGHGALAERALIPVIPTLDSFPYTIRVVSETLESNGSSSMASVCGSTLALMDAGVPIKSPVAGIAMGLIKEGDDVVILTDIQGAEDHLGDMDFKVAGTDEGITALQMDIKITGVTTELLRAALSQAKEARLKILDAMLERIPEHRPEVNPNAPRIEQVKIDPDQIGMVIGKGGETIRGLEEEFGTSISIQEDGLIQIYGVDFAAAKGCAEAIEAMTKEIVVGDEFDGTVVKTTDFGAFVELKKGVDGLLHISAMGAQRVDNVEDVVVRGDKVGVKVQEVDLARGRISLVMIRDKDGNAVEQRAPRAGGGDDDRPRGGGGDRDRGPRSGGGGGGRGGDRGRSGGGGGRGGSGGGGGRGGNGGGSGGPRGEGRGPRTDRDERPARDGGVAPEQGVATNDEPRGERAPRAEGEGGRSRGSRGGRGRGGSGGGEGGGRSDGGNREGGNGGDRAPREQAPAQAQTKAPEPATGGEEGGFGRRFRMRLRGGNDGES